MLIKTQPNDVDEKICMAQSHSDGYCWEKKEFQVNKLFYVLCRVNTTFKDCLKYDNVDSDN